MKTAQRSVLYHSIRICRFCSQCCWEHCLQSSQAEFLRIKQKNGPSKTGHGSYVQKRLNILPSKGCLHVYSHDGRCVENLLSSWGGAGEPKTMTKSTCTGPWIPVPLELSMKLWLLPRPLLLEVAHIPCSIWLSLLDDSSSSLMRP